MYRVSRMQILPAINQVHLHSVNWSNDLFPYLAENQQKTHFLHIFPQNSISYKNSPVHRTSVEATHLLASYIINRDWCLHTLGKLEQIFTCFSVRFLAIFGILCRLMYCENVPVVLCQLCVWQPLSFAIKYWWNAEKEVISRRVTVPIQRNWRHL